MIISYDRLIFEGWSESNNSCGRKMKTLGVERKMSFVCLWCGSSWKFHLQHSLFSTRLVSCPEDISYSAAFAPWHLPDNFVSECQSSGGCVAKTCVAMTFIFLCESRKTSWNSDDNMTSQKKCLFWKYSRVVWNVLEETVSCIMFAFVLHAEKQNCPWQPWILKLQSLILHRCDDCLCYNTFSIKNTTICSLLQYCQTFFPFL